MTDTRREKLLVFGILFVAAFFRFFRLDSLPPGFQFDQAFNAFDILRLLQGQFAIFFPANTGREPLYFYLAIVGVAVAGPTALALKLTSAIVGLVTIPVVYAFARTFFSFRVAVLAALFTAVSFWHTFFSRDGLRVILAVPLTTLVFWYYWRAALAERGARKRDWALAGHFLALALYTYPSARLLPVALIALTAYAAWSERADRLEVKRHLLGLGLTLGVAALFFIPLAAYFVQHPDQFFSHSAQVSIFVPHGEIGDNAGAELGKNLLRVLGMFFVAGDAGALRNLPGRPVFDPLTGALFAAGVIVLLVALFSPRSAREHRDRAVLLAVWLGISLGASLFSDDAPNFLRTLPALPAVMLVLAWGVSTIWDWLSTIGLGRAGAVACAGLIFLSGSSAFWDYFVVLAQDPGTYYAFDTDKVEMANWANRIAPTSHLFLAPLLQQNGTISLLTHLAPLKSFESRDTIVLPDSQAGKDALFAFPYEQDRKVQTMAARLAALGEREELTGSNGAKLLLLYRVPAQNLPNAEQPFEALDRGGSFVQAAVKARTAWEDGLALLGYTLSPEGPGGRNLTVTLFLQAQSALQRDYTFSIKVWDSRGRVWGQEDKWAGNNSYLTSHWGAGEVVVEKFYPGLSACAPAGEYRVTVEVYEPKTMSVQRLEDGQSVAQLGTFQAGPSEGNRYEDLEPEETTDANISPELHLMGWTMTPRQVRPGDPFSLSLFWRGVRGRATAKIKVQTPSAVLGETRVELPDEGRGLCTLFDMQAPADLAPGEHPILINGAQTLSFGIVR